MNKRKQIKKRNQKLILAGIITVLVSIVLLVGSKPVPASQKPEYLDLAGQENVHFGSGIDMMILPLAINGKNISSLVGVKYPQAIMKQETYQSNEPFTVTHLASIWAKILLLNPNPGANVPNDVHPGEWYYDAFERLSKTHILDYLMDENGNINPNRQLSVYEIHRSIKYYWDYSGAEEVIDNDIISTSTGQQYRWFINRASDFHKRYKGRIWYKDVAPVVNLGFVYGLVDNNQQFVFAEKPAVHRDAMAVFCVLTGRFWWNGMPGSDKDIEQRTDLAGYEKAALQPYQFLY